MKGGRTPMRRERQEQAITPAVEALAQVGPSLWWQPSPKPETEQTFRQHGQTFTVETVVASDGGWLFTTKERSLQ